tara:strand:- start:1147 stop:2133 length:987 start_codon:yes stop_codon:yes gene_type:complete
LNNIIKKKINRSIKALIFLFPITLACYLFFSEFGQSGNLLFLINKLFFQISFGLFLVSIGYVMRYLRWRLIINSFGFYPLIKIESKIWLASYSFTATPGKLGELIRCFFLKKIFNIPLKYSLFSIIFERLFDLIAAIIFAVCFFTIKYKYLIVSSGQILIIGIIFFIVLTLLLRIQLIDYRKLLAYFIEKKFKFLGKVFKFEDVIKLSNLKTLLKMNILFKITLLSLFSWGLEGLSFFLLIKSLNFDISLLTATFIHTTSGFLGALTMLPGGLVFTEAITVSILKLQTIPTDYGIPITSIIRLMTLWYITFLGSISLFIIRKEVFKDV